MEGIIFLVWIVIIIAGTISASKNKNKANDISKIKRPKTVYNNTNFNSSNYNNSNYNNQTNYSIPKSQDIRCETKYGHSHRPEYSMKNGRYIVHDKPTTGYIVLNGVKYSRNELKNK